MKIPNKLQIFTLKQATGTQTQVMLKKMFLSQRDPLVCVRQQQIQATSNNIPQLSTKIVKSTVILPVHINATTLIIQSTMIPDLTQSLQSLRRINTYDPCRY